MSSVYGDGTDASPPEPIDWHSECLKERRRAEKAEHENAELRNLLSQWYETYNDQFNPDGDLLDATSDAIDAAIGKP